MIRSLAAWAGRALRSLYRTARSEGAGVAAHRAIELALRRLARLRARAQRPAREDWRAALDRLTRGDRPVAGVVVYAPRGTSDGALARTLACLAAQRYRPLRVLVSLEAPAREALRAHDLKDVGEDVRLDASEPLGLDDPWILSCAYAMLIGAGDLLEPDAIGELVLAALSRRADVAYADELGVSSKPGFSPELLESTAYIGQPLLFTTSRAPSRQPLAGPDRALAYALALHVTRGAEVTHVRRVLCRREAIDPPELASAQREVMRRSLRERGVEASVEPAPRGQRVRYAIEGAPRVSIVVPTRDRLELLRACLASLERSTYAHREVVIVDNGSIERETLAFLAECPHRVLRIDEPYNFSRLNNRAVREACTGAQLLFLNNDTQVIAPDWLEALLEHAQREGVGAAGAKLLYPDGRLQHAGLVYTRARFRDAHVFLPEIGVDPFTDCVRNFTAVTAACMMVPRRAFDAVGGFDERFAVAFNDVDLCLRLRQAGYRIVYTPHAVLHHAEGSTRGRGRQPVADERRLEERWLRTLDPDPYAGG